MSSGRLFSFEYFPSLQNNEEFFNKIIGAERAGKRIANQLLLVILFSFLYGVIMGSYQGWLQAIAAGAKVSALFVLSLIICFPAFFIIQYILG